MNKTILLKKLQQVKAGARPRSAWRRGVYDYAESLLDNLDPCEDYNAATLRRALLNGAVNWREYSWGGCSKIYDSNIARALCNNTELKRTDGGRLPPNRQETWLDVQARALFQAAAILQDIVEAGRL